MDRPKRSASKVTNFRTFHLSGDLDTSLQGKVGQVVNAFEDKLSQSDTENSPHTSPDSSPKRDMGDAEKLQKELEEKRAATKLAAQQAEEMKLRNELEGEELRQQEWELAMDQMKKKRERMMQLHQAKIEEIKRMTEDTEEEEGNSDMISWLKEQLNKIKQPSEDTKLKEQEEQARLEQERLKQIEDIRNQQQQLAQKLAELTGEPKEGPSVSQKGEEQALLLQQLQTALNPQPEKDPQKAILRALTTQANKTVGTGGVHTLRPDILQKITNQEPGHSMDMSDWLAQFNREEEGESLLRLGNTEGEGECKHTKLKSGMLDKSSMNIKQKQIWPQKNLGEDWAEDELDFKQIRFEHMVAGETRTIETCSEPAQILGRLRLLRRIAYLRLRGYEWTLLRRMYAAILTSIETGEYSWESNFDRFETILYRRATFETKPRQDRDRYQDRDRNQEKKTWYCRDFNKDGCSRQSPHQAWFGSGSSAIRKQVVHACAICLLKDRTARDHPEKHPDCPHSD